MAAEAPQILTKLARLAVILGAGGSALQSSLYTGTCFVSRELTFSCVRDSFFVEALVKCSLMLAHSG